MINSATHILASYIDGTLKEPLSNLEIFQNGTSLGTGNAKLFFNTNRRLQIDIASESLPIGYDLSSPRGTLVPETEMYQIKAKTTDGLDCKAERLHPKSISRSVSDGSQVSFEPNYVKLTSSKQSESKSVFDAFVSQFECAFFNRHCRPGDENQYFGDTLTGSWFFMETDAVVVGLRKEKSGAMHLKITSKKEELINLEKHAVAFVNALSFHVSRRLKILCCCQRTQFGEEITLARQDYSMAKEFYEPIPDYEPAASEKLLWCAMNFFLKEESAPVLTALNICWESTKVTFLADCLLVCSVVEGLADHILKDAKYQYERLRNRLLDLLRNEPEAKGSLCFEQFERNIKDAGFSTDKESIKKAAALLKISVISAELQAWGRLRHRLAHGDYSLDSESHENLQSEIDRANCVANIVNKFVLALIGYEGLFHNYSETGYPIRPFP